MEIYDVILIHIKSKQEMTIHVEVDETEETDYIVINADINEEKFISENYSYFSAFQEFRDKLLEKGYGIKCNGSKINAVQSGMMSATDKIYLVEKGKQSLIKDMVHLWDYADIDDFPDTKQQNSFFEEWINSLRG